MSDIYKESIFNHSSYKAYLISKFGTQGTRKGGRSRLAKHLNCQTAFVSQVLNKNANFSLEQAYKINSFLGHDKNESEAFILLVLKERAGSVDLHNYFKEKFNDLKFKMQSIKSRLNETVILDEQAQAEYYSQWYYLAIHMIVSIKEFQNREAIASHLNLPVDKVASCLDFLQRHKLIVFKDGRYKFGPRHIHLDEKSVNILKHHLNWRLVAMKSLDNLQDRSDVHYSVVYSLSKKDVSKIKERFLKIIKENIKTISSSGEEVLYCNTIDFFEI